VIDGRAVRGRSSSRTGVRTSTVVLVNFARKIILIGGSRYGRRDQEVGLLGQ